MGSILFEKVNINGLELKNRILMSAAAAWKATGEGDIISDDPLIQYLVAEGGPALIISGGTAVHDSGRLSEKSAIFDDDKRIPSFRYFARKIQEAGAKAAFQATHSGLWAGYPLSRGKKPFAPSFIIHDEICFYKSSNREDCPAPEELIREVIEAYGDAAARAQKAGFDAVEVHGAHDSLLAQFLSPVTNRREDQWGGAVENRCRLHCEIMANIRGKVRKNFPVILKLGVKEDLEGGLTLEDGVTAAKIIAEKGDTDAIEVSQGLSAGIKNFNYTSMKTGITDIDKEAYYREWTKLVRKEIPQKILVIMQGGLRSPELMEEIINNGEADIVSMCRPYICEPNLVKRWEGGDEKKAKCISCNRCLVESHIKGAPLKCIIAGKK